MKSQQKFMVIFWLTMGAIAFAIIFWWLVSLMFNAVLEV